MDVLTTPADMRAWSADRRRRGSVGMVPTMGALHDGHLALVADARGRADAVVVSIFVNPMQFNRTDDFDRYPRPIDEDLAMCREAGVDAVYAPTAAAMYPPGFDTAVEPGDIAERWEGAGRPGHFRGVTTVVAKLFAAARPDLAVFGRKDFQQLAVIRRMVTDLDLGVQIVGHETVREADGLAMSSRNRRLDPHQRAAAGVVPASISAMARCFADGIHSAEILEAAGAEVVAGEPTARLEYLRIVDPDTLEPRERADADSTVIAAIWFGEIRLIDNLRLGDGPIR